MNPLGIDQCMREIAECCGTPFYVYGLDEIQHSFASLQAALGPQTHILYSMKANPNPFIAQALVELGAGVEAASGGELRLALCCGVSAERIVFAGPGKTDEELQLAVEAGILAVNVESINEADRLQRISDSAGRRTRATLRVNPLQPVGDARIQMGGCASQFGVDQEWAEEVLQYMLGLPALQCVGVHVYAGTQVLDGQALAGHVGRVLAMGHQWAREYGLEMINIGGGFGIPCYPGQTPLDLTPVGQAVADAVAEHARLGGQGVGLYAESGRYLVGPAGTYVARIIDIKESRGLSFVVLDGGINHHPGSTGMGRTIRRNRKLRLVGAESGQPARPVNIVGPLCTSADWLAEEWEMPANARVGDLVAIADSGAYCRSASPLGFLSHDWPGEFLVDGLGAWRCIAPRITAQDVQGLQMEKLADER